MEYIKAFVVEWIDLHAGTDPDRKNKDDAGADRVAGGQRECSGIPWRL